MYHLDLCITVSRKRSVSAGRTQDPHPFRMQRDIVLGLKLKKKIRYVNWNLVVVDLSEKPFSRPCLFKYQALIFFPPPVWMSGINREKGRIEDKIRYF